MDSGSRLSFAPGNDRMPKSLPYRPCVGLCVINSDGLVFVGRRSSGIEQLDGKYAWQMPQGGIDDGEDPYPAAMRELYEETSIRSVEKIGEIEGWLSYDIPASLGRHAWSDKYRGQTQKWFALRFTGRESEINIVNPGDGHKPEFIEWRWEKLAKTPDLIVPFKRETYERVVKEFAPLAKQTS